MAIPLLTKVIGNRDTRLSKTAWILFALLFLSAVNASIFFNMAIMAALIIITILILTSKYIVLSQYGFVYRNYLRKRSKMWDGISQFSINEKGRVFCEVLSTGKIIKLPKMSENPRLIADELNHYRDINLQNTSETAGTKNYD